MSLLCRLEVHLNALCLLSFVAFGVCSSDFSSADERPAPKNENVLYSNIPSGRPYFGKGSLLAWNPSGSEYALASGRRITKYSRNGLPIASVTSDGYVDALVSQDGILAYRADSSKKGEDVVGLNWNDLSESWAIRATYDIDGVGEGALIIETENRLRVSTLANPDSSFLLSQSLQQLRERDGAMLLINDDYAYAVLGMKKHEVRGYFSDIAIISLHVVDGSFEEKSKVTLEKPRRRRTLDRQPCLVAPEANAVLIASSEGTIEKWSLASGEWKASYSLVFEEETHTARSMHIDSSGRVYAFTGSRVLAVTSEGTTRLIADRVESFRAHPKLPLAALSLDESLGIVDLQSGHVDGVMTLPLVRENKLKLLSAVDDSRSFLIKPIFSKGFSQLGTLTATEKFQMGGLNSLESSSGKYISSEEASSQILHLQPILRGYINGSPFLFLFDIRENTLPKIVAKVPCTGTAEQSVAWHPGGDRFFFQGGHKPIRGGGVTPFAIYEFDCRDLKSTLLFERVGNTSEAADICVTDQNKVVVLDRTEVTIFDLVNRSKKSVPWSRGGNFSCRSLISNGRLVFVQRGKLLWATLEEDQGEIVAHPDDGQFDEPVKFIAVASDERVLVVAGSSAHICEWDDAGLYTVQQTTLPVENMRSWMFLNRQYLIGYNDNLGRLYNTDLSTLPE